MIEDDEDRDGYDTSKHFAGILRDAAAAIERGEYTIDGGATADYCALSWEYCRIKADTGPRHYDVTIVYTREYTDEEKKEMMNHEHSVDDRRHPDPQLAGVHLVLCQ